MYKLNKLFIFKSYESIRREFKKRNSLSNEQLDSVLKRITDGSRYKGWHLLISSANVYSTIISWWSEYAMVCTLGVGKDFTRFSKRNVVLIFKNSKTGEESTIETAITFGEFFKSKGAFNKKEFESFHKDLLFEITEDIIRNGEFQECTGIQTPKL